MKELKLDTVGKIIITKNLEEIIDSLHGLIGATEWSGILFYKLKRGKIQNMKDLVFEADHIHLMDIGTVAHTGFAYDGEMVEPFDFREELIDYQMGMAHTHHQLGAFMSGTDISELQDNAKHYNYYISLVVDFKKEYVCKIVFPSKSIHKYTSDFKDDNGKIFKKTFTSEEDILYVGDLDVVMPQDIKTYPQWIVDRHKELVDKKKQSVVQSQIGFNSNRSTYSSFGKNRFEDVYGYDDWEIGGYHKYSGFGNNKHNTSLNDETEQFISALIFLDDTKKYIDVWDAFAKFEKLNEVEEDIYAETLDSNIETIHFNLFKQRRDCIKDCHEVVQYLEDNQSLYSDNPVYEILLHVLNEYAESTVQ